VRLKTRVLAIAGSLAMVGSMVAVAAPASAAPTVIGNCGGSVSLGTLTPPLGDQTAAVVASTKLLKSVLGAKPTLGGVCNTNPAFANGNSTTTPKAQAAKLSGRASCANGAPAQAVDATAATQYPLNGKISTTMTETGADTKPLVIQSYIALLGAATSGNPFGDVFNLGGIVIKGVGVGATTTGSIWQDPVSKLLGKARSGVTLNTTNGSPTVTSSASPAVGAAKFVANDVGGTITGTGIPAGAVITAVNSATSVTISANATASGTATNGILNAGNYDTGYLLDISGAVGCQDTTPGNGTITTVLVGGGGASASSILGGTGSGLIFSFGQ
jgi:hypothetical protein